MKNVGAIDKTLRIVAGVALILLAVVPSAYQTPWGWIGLVFLATALMSWCPAYSLLGIRTCKVPPGSERDGAPGAA